MATIAAKSLEAGGRARAALRPGLAAGRDLPHRAVRDGDRRPPGDRHDPARRQPDARRGRAARLAFSPNADGRADRIAFRFELSGPAEVRLRILRDGKWVATPFKGPLEPGVRKVEWDGIKRVGRLLDGTL